MTTSQLPVRFELPRTSHSLLAELAYESGRRPQALARHVVEQYLPRYQSIFPLVHESVQDCLEGLAHTGAPLLMAPETPRSICLSDTRQWTHEHFDRRVDALLAILEQPVEIDRFSGPTPSTTTPPLRTLYTFHKWWGVLKQQDARAKSAFVHLLEHLEARCLKTDDFFNARNASNGQPYGGRKEAGYSAAGTISFIDYRLRSCYVAEHPPEGDGRGLNPAPLSMPEELQLAKHLDRLAPESAQAPARAFWKELKSRNAGREAWMLALTKRMLALGASVDEFHHAWVYSRGLDCYAVLHWLEYARVQRRSGYELHYSREYFDIERDRRRSDG